jgi:predicted nuclease with TOPRIM domain
MFFYIAYEDFRNKYLDAQKKYNEILMEKEDLFQKTQPKSVIYDKEKINTGYIQNAFDDYLNAKEKSRIEERLNEIKSILDDRGRLLHLKERELLNSKSHIDQIYKMRYLDCYNIRKIAKISCYSVSQVYRILESIKKTLKNKKII